MKYRFPENKDTALFDKEVEDLKFAYQRIIKMSEFIDEANHEEWMHIINFFENTIHNMESKNSEIATFNPLYLKRYLDFGDDDDKITVLTTVLAQARKKLQENELILNEMKNWNRLIESDETLEKEWNRFLTLLKLKGTT